MADLSKLLTSRSPFVGFFASDVDFSIGGIDLYIESDIYAVYLL